MISITYLTQATTPGIHKTLIKATSPKGKTSSGIPGELRADASLSTEEAPKPISVTPSLATPFFRVQASSEEDVALRTSTSRALSGSCRPSPAHT